jgi:hypothetical protein
MNPSLPSAPEAAEETQRTFKLVQLLQATLESSYDDLGWDPHKLVTLDEVRLDNDVDHLLQVKLRPIVNSCSFTPEQIAEKIGTSLKDNLERNRIGIFPLDGGINSQLIINIVINEVRVAIGELQKESMISVEWVEEWKKALLNGILRRN